MVNPRAGTRCHDRSRDAVTDAFAPVPTELVRALAAFLERPGDTHTRLADLLGLDPPDDHTWTQVVVFNLYPHASVHLGEAGKLGGEARDRIAGFFRALDTTPPPEPDHLIVLLAAWAQLEDRAADEPRADHAATTLLTEHLVSWLPGYLARMVALAPSPYRDWAALLAEVLHVAAGQRPRAVHLPLHLRSTSPLEDPREVGDDAMPLVEQLLAPARCGFVLTTADLRRAGRETGLALRIGERRWVLDNLFGQSVPTTLAWLADHAVESTTQAWDPWRDVAPATADWWVTRAEATAAVLDDLASEAATATVVPVV